MHITVTVPHNIHSDVYSLYIMDYVVTVYDIDPTGGDYVHEFLELAEFSHEFANLEE